MPEKIINKKNIVFGLDIGTRSIVGSVGYLEDKNKFNVIAHYAKEHETRAMIDGQIHDIGKVSETINKVKKELEMQIEMPLKDVCIAAAGRVLKTVTIHVDMEINTDLPVTDDDIYSLDMLGVEKAYEIVREEEKDINFYCVGYTVVKYYLNNFVISNLEGHKAKTISADVLATFLPDEVVEGLYSAVEGADLNVSNLTLEPIAAINVAIPEKFRLLNIALVDVGAGTSDISITKDGSIIAYGMIPRAGDELTETIVSRYLVDFAVAEKIKRASLLKRQITFKDIMGLKQKVSPEEVRDSYFSTVNSITKEIADKIMELNGGKSVSAVFVVGGGGKVCGFTQTLAKHLDIPQERVALRGEEVLTDIHFEQEDVKKDPLLVTPIGICLSYYEHKNNFVFVNVNDERIKLYDNDKLTIVDAALAIGLPNDAFFPKRGEAVEYYLNGEKRMVRGEMGEPSVILINGETANINSKINKNDSIIIKESTAGKDAVMFLEFLKEYNEVMHFIVNGQKLEFPKFIRVNGEIQTTGYQIKNGDKVEIFNHYTLDEFLEYMDIDKKSNFIRINNVEAKGDEQIFDNFYVDFEKINYVLDEDLEENSAKEDSVQSREPDIEYKEDEKPTLNNSTPDEASDNIVSSQSIVGNYFGGTENLKVEDSTVSNIVPEIKDIVITVNGSPVRLKNKKEYIFVDILDFYPFDTSALGGKELVMTVNGEKCEFTSKIFEGDAIELYWQK